MNIQDCRRIPNFERSHFGLVQSAFRDATALSFRQAWRHGEENDFASGTVRIGWREEALLVFAELADKDVFTRATGSNQRFWELGDVFEIFVMPGGGPAYFEFQVAPNNQQLQLRYADAAAVERARRTGAFEPHLIAGQAFYSSTRARPEEQRWFVVAEIFAKTIGRSPGPAAGEWKVSFGRYDYTRGRPEPVVSSTSPHAECDFHRSHEWSTIRFRE